MIIYLRNKIFLVSKKVSLKDLTYTDKQKMNLYLSLFFCVFNCPRSKLYVFRELAINFAEGRRGPAFLDTFTVEEFLDISKLCFTLLKRDLNGERYGGFLKLFCSWLLKDSEGSSLAALEILGLIKVSDFKFSDIKGLIEKLELCEKFKGLQSVFQLLQKTSE